VLGVMLIDPFGLMRSLTSPLTPARLVGAMMMIAGAFLALRR